MKHILLIEDNEDHAELIEHSLHRSADKINMHLAYSADQAYPLLEQKKFDLILSDYYLPGTDGDHHIQELNKRAPCAPIIVITGNGDEEIAARSIQSGAEDYIVKTREALEDLPKIIQQTIVKHRSQLKSKKRENQQRLKHEEEKAKKVLGEVEAIGKKMKKLKTSKNKNSVKLSKGKNYSTLDHLSEQVETLKKFIRSTFFKR